MAVFIAGEGAAAQQMKALTERLDREGAWFNPDLEIRIDGPDVSMLSRNLFTDRRSIIRVPVASMPVLDDFELMLKDGNFSCTPTSDAASDAQIATMTDMIEIYNVLGKIDQWKAETPWFTLRDHPKVLDHLLKGRVRSKQISTLQALSSEGQWDKLAADTFLGSRKFNLSEANAKLIGREAPQGLRILMPVIDYFNHRMNAQGFRIAPMPLPPSMRIQSVPDLDTGELFVRYNVFDVLDTYLYYGFIDAGVGYLSSVPCEIQIGDKTLRVMGGGGVKAQKLAPSVKDLHLFMPTLQKTDDQSYTASKIVIPGPKAPRALRRVLAVVMNSLGLPKDKIKDHLLEAEAKILEANETWWAELDDAAQALSADHALHQLCQVGRDHVAQYRTLQEKFT